MLGYFPAPYPSELLYSMIARFAVHTGTRDQKQITADCFGVRTVAAVADFPSHLRQFCKSVRPVWTIYPEQILQHHTLMPAFLIYVSPKQADMAVNSALSDNGGNIHTRLGIAASNIFIPSRLRICVACYEEQTDSIGEPYWQREAQIPGACVCPKHHCTFSSTTTSYHPLGKHNYQPAITARLEKKAALCTLSPTAKKIFIGLSDRLSKLLNVPIGERVTAWQWTQFYRSMATELGLLKGNRVDHAGIHQLVCSKTPRSVLLTLNSTIHNSQQGWLLDLFRKHRKAFHPIRHLLLWQLVRPQSTLQEILDEAHSYPRSPAVLVRATGQDMTKVESIRYKKQWLKLISHNPECGIKDLRTKTNGARIYAWLYRHEREWLGRNSPPRKKVHALTGRVEWHQRDRYFVKQLIGSNKISRGNLNLPRKTRAWYFNKFQQRAMLEKNLNKLPLCRMFLDKYAESIEQYQKRRIYRVAKDLFRQDSPLKKWVILRKAGLRTDKLTVEVKHWLEQVEDIVSSGQPDIF